MYKLVSKEVSNEDGEHGIVYGVSCGDIKIDDVCCYKEPTERFISSLNVCLLPLDLLWVVVEHWVEHYRWDLEV